ncbi:MAG: glycosyltransferase family 4 protein [Nitrososphaerales archaeon]
MVPFYRGASTHVLEVAKGLAELGDDVHVLSRRLDGSQARAESLDGVLIHRIYRGIFRSLPGSRYSSFELGESERGGFLMSAYRLYLSTLFTFYAGLVSLSLIHKHRIHVILERETAFGAGAVASRASGVPLVLEVVGPRYSQRSMAIAKKILAYTSTMIGEADNARVVLVDAGVDSDRFSPSSTLGQKVRRQLGIEEGDLVVGYVGTFQTWHGLESLLDAFERLAPEFPNLRALLVGPYFGPIRERARSMGLLGRCVFTGPVAYDDVVDYVNACQIMVAPYDPRRSRIRSERGIGSPLKVLEYMACGKPVVTSDLEPTNRIPGLGNAALLVPPGDSGAIADALRTLLLDKGLADRMGLAGRTLVEQGYSWRKFASGLHGILEDVASGRAS